MIAPEVSEQTYNHIGVPDAFHALSHHANDAGEEGRGWCMIQRYHTQVFAKFLDQAVEDAGRRRQHAGQLDAALRQQHEQQQRAQPVSAADGGDRRRLRQDARRAAHQLRGAHAARERAADDAAARGRAHREGRRQHRRDRGDLTMMRVRLARRCVTLALALMCPGRAGRRGRWRGRAG